MPATIDYFYSYLSPYAFFGQQILVDLAEKYEAKINFRPVNLAVLFPQTGGLPVPKRHPARQAYRFIELQRWSEKRGIPIRYKPAHHPTDIRLTDKVAIVLQEQGGPVHTYSLKAFSAVWQKDQDAADENIPRSILHEMQLDGDQIISRAKSDEITMIYDENVRYAEEVGAIGSPTYLVNGEPFWGQDRLDLLEDALKSGRAPFKPL